MKRLFVLSCIILLINAKSYSQTKQFPFYGFELSNYEVGDTLEYAYTSDGNECHEMQLITILNKTTTGKDSIKYVYQFLKSGYCSDGMHGYNYQSIDTISTFVNNDTVFNNYNNLLGKYLYRIFPDSIGGNPVDSNYIIYDTINGLKRLRGNVAGFNEYSGYYVMQNIGLIEMYEREEVGIDWAIGLIYAHLFHFGFYETYQPVILGVDKINRQQPDVSIRYSNDNPSLFLSSSKNLPYYNCTIYDLLGRALKTMPVNIGNNPVNLYGFTKGMYLYKVSSNGNVLGQGKLMNL